MNVGGEARINVIISARTIENEDDDTSSLMSDTSDISTMGAVFDPDDFPIGALVTIGSTSPNLKLQSLLFQPYKDKERSSSRRGSCMKETETIHEGDENEDSPSKEDQLAHKNANSNEKYKYGSSSDRTKKNYSGDESKEKFPKKYPGKSARKQVGNDKNVRNSSDSKEWLSNQDFIAANGTNNEDSSDQSDSHSPLQPSGLNKIFDSVNTDSLNDIMDKNNSTDSENQTNYNSSNPINNTNRIDNKNRRASFQSIIESLPAVPDKWCESESSPRSSNISHLDAVTALLESPNKSPMRSPSREIKNSNSNDENKNNTNINNNENNNNDNFNNRKGLKLSNKPSYIDTTNEEKILLYPEIFKNEPTILGQNPKVHGTPERFSLTTGWDADGNISREVRKTFFVMYQYH